MSEASLRRGRITRAEGASSYPPYPADWYIQDEEQVPESRPHDLEGEHLRQIFLGWKDQLKRNAAIGRNIAVRWDEQHRGVGVDPDVYILEDPPSDFDHQPSLRVWEPGHHPPLLAVEIVSESRAEKDYSESPLKYAMNGTHELWIFDPKLSRRSKHGEPARLQVWRRDDEGDFNRIYEGEGPAYSEALHAWIFVTNEGHNLNIADDAEGTIWWMTPAEREREAKLQERAAKEAALKQLAAERTALEQERLAKEQERLAKEQALARIAQLEALLATRT
ncbi:MAG TPA: Uma2 family endonuclease [Polyangium sp.]|nr:Uma2 family endonuclease [Polyangium sp.]